MGRDDSLQGSPLPAARNRRRMAILALLQFDTDPACAQRKAAVSGIGFQVVEAEPRWPDFFKTIEEKRPDVVVIGGGVIPQHAREAARYLGDGFNTRNIPVILVGVAPKDVPAAREAAPRAQIVDEAALPDALHRFKH